jgi:hypothetical protein
MSGWRPPICPLKQKTQDRKKYSLLQINNRPRSISKCNISLWDGVAWMRVRGVERIYIQSRLEWGFKATAIASALKRGRRRSAASCGATVASLADIPSAINETVRQHADVAARAV